MATGHDGNNSVEASPLNGEWGNSNTTILYIVITELDS